MTVLLNGQALAKSYGPRPLFANISVNISAGERVGLIGPNGSGKSTLLRLLSGLELPDHGNITVRRTVRLGYLPQEVAFGMDLTVKEVLASALLDDAGEEHERTTQVAITLGKAGLGNGEQRVGTLSGGWLRRVAIARELVRRPDLLLLDEPTNHLDLEGIVWLEELLEESPFAYMVVSHDRYFLENVTNQVIELDRVYPDGYFRVAGSYSEFLSRRAEFLAGQMRQQQSLTSKVRREVAWLQRGARARTGKSSARIQEATRLGNDLQALRDRNAPAEQAAIDFVATGRRSTKLLSVKGIAKTLGGRALFADLSFMLSPGTRIGVLGANGSGKTTLLRALAGETTLDAGTIERIEGLRVVAFDQDRRQLDRSATLCRALAPNADDVLYRDQPIHVSAWAKRFLFRPEQLDQAIGDLSGGEQARVLIARLMLQPADVLLLDEPTNDLDIATLEVLEESLAEFPGAVVMVTHDRSLLDRLCTEILGMDGQGHAALFADYTQWAAAERARDYAKRKPTTSPARAPKTSRRSAGRLSYHEQREWDGMEARILAAEQELSVLQQEVEAAGQGTDHVRLQEACQALHAAQEAIEKLYRRWQELENEQT